MKHWGPLIQGPVRVPKLAFLNSMVLTMTDGQRARQTDGQTDRDRESSADLLIVGHRDVLTETENGTD